MKHLSRILCVIAFAALAFAACAQDTNVLGGCIGKGWPAYAKAFEDKFTEKKGGAVIAEYKTGQAKVVVTQTAGAKIPNVFDMFFYQQPKRDWKSALATCGLSTAGVKATDAGHGKVKLSGIRKGSLKLTGVFVQMATPTSDGPELHLKLH